MSEYIQHYSSVLSLPPPSSAASSSSPSDINPSSFKFPLMPEPDLTDETFKPMLDVFNEYLLKVTTSIQHSLDAPPREPQPSSKGL
jgi:hypothetical protein